MIDRRTRRRRSEQFQDTIGRLYPDLIKTDENGSTIRSLSRTVTFQVTDGCNLACTYCYQTHKGTKIMSVETAKKFIDLLLSGDKGMHEYVNPDISPAIIIDFIGGEPFLAIDLISEICDYFFHEAIRLHHPWAEKHMFSLCSNGVLYRTEKVQKFLQKHRGHLSLAITVDGNQELHDSCRVFPDGSPSYHYAVDAVTDWMSKGYYMGSKITIAPGNIHYIYDAIVHMITLGYLDINANCVYEKGWTLEHASILYNQMKKLSDYLIHNHLAENIFVALFEERYFKPKEETDLNNWCFRAGTLISTPKGMVPIEDLNNGDEVYTKGYEIHKIQDLMTRDAFDGIELKVSGMYKTFTTANHPYFCKRFKGISSKGKDKYYKPEWIKASDLKIGDKVALSVKKFGRLNLEDSHAYLIGRYIGDGWHSTTGYKICCGYHEYEELKSWFDSANLDYSIDKYPTVYQFNILKSNTEFLLLLNECGSSAKDKHLPFSIYEYSINTVEMILKGLFDADGYYRPGYKLQRFNTISYALAVELCEVLRSLGYFPTCSIDERAGESIIDGRKVNIRDRYEVSFKTDMSSRFMNYDEEYDVVWSTIRSVKDVDENYTVYNMTVEDNHSFIANGAIVHNCGGTGLMLACDPDGYLYPCLRYMRSSLGDRREPITIGHVDEGIGLSDHDKEIIKTLNAIDRRTQSTDECFYCPIGEGCSWCSAYNYEVNGTADSRVTYICEMHKARALANYYHWAKYYESIGSEQKVEIWIPDQWALKIISKEEWEMIKHLKNVILMNPDNKEMIKL